ncbi:hypothetical protein PHISP_06912 [Aspergillus sp. HF37]|nr:hypothetical protein PHISP_06912 [Aspergillus sp. HF37]
MRGEAVPGKLDTTTAQCCVVRGIRCHYGFATSPAIEKLCADFRNFARARNARLIMSDVVPDNLDDQSTQPFCIWHPDIAREDTYRELAHRCPAMRYQVGRACAAAGYVGLYKELDLLPDVSIAEEAREGDSDGGREIYELIMAVPVKYAVVSDRDRTINTEDPKAPAYLNADTCVRWALENRNRISDCGKREIKIKSPDIEEDGSVGTKNASIPIWRGKLTFEETKLLYSPLPLDLPTMKKELLREMAAYEGNIDRYARLMDPDGMTKMEVACVERGIYHSTMFARWWADLLKANTRRIRYSDHPWSYRAEATYSIKTAINARRIMSNEVSGFTDSEPYLPYLIWWPVKPHPYTLSTLAEKCPSMKTQIVIACIHCDYEFPYRKLDFEPSPNIWEAALASPNPFYRADVEKRAAEQGIDLTDEYEWQEVPHCIQAEWKPRSSHLYTPLFADLMSESLDIIERPNPNMIERYVWQPLHRIRNLEARGGGFWEGNTEYLDGDASAE